MKETDYAPRAAIFDKYLSGSNLVGIEIGVDVGAHAEAMLLYCDIKHITLVDIWDKEYYRGYCCGRLRWCRHKITMVIQTAEKFDPPGEFDFVYCDLPQTYELTMMMLKRWWPKIRKGGVIGIRGIGFKEVARACTEFSKDFIIYDEEAIMVKQ